MNNNLCKIEMIEEIIGEMNTGIQLYKNNYYERTPYTVRMVDFDTNKTITCILCPTLKMAYDKMNELID